MTSKVWVHKVGGNEADGMERDPYIRLGIVAIKYLFPEYHRKSGEELVPTKQPIKVIFENNAISEAPLSIYYTKENGIHTLDAANFFRIKNAFLYTKNILGLKKPLLNSLYLMRKKDDFLYIIEVKASDSNYSFFESSKDITTLINDSKIKYNFHHNSKPLFKIKNLLLKGVPGTGKSHLINEIIDNKLGLKSAPDYVLKINIHSGSSNSDFMQGIGINTTEENKIEYKEKQGVIFDFIGKACAEPNLPFVLVLEEIQENSLNELIGDLIYLIESDKRSELKNDLGKIGFESIDELVECHFEKNNIKHYVKIPNLIDSDKKYRKMFMPDNLFVFCTSNYRDDKKIIEDNLLRRFDTIDVFPDSSQVSKKAKIFFEQLNENILDVLSSEFHPDRFQIGHAVWMYLDEEKTGGYNNNFAKALYKTIIELKEIREIQPSQLVEILRCTFEVSNTGIPPSIEEAFKNCTSKGKFKVIDFIKYLQGEAYSDILILLENKE